MFGALQSFLTTGLIFGWPALVPLLAADGQYRERCSTANTTESETCTEQVIQYNFLFTASQAVFTISMIVHGLLLDRYGPRVESTLGTLLVAIGSCIVAFSDSDGRDFFLPGFVVMSLGGPAVHLSWFHVASLFPERKSTISTVVVACFVSSGLMFFFFNLLRSAGIPFQTIFLVHSGVVACMAALAAMLWPDRPFPLNAAPCFDGACSLRY